jgi:4-hydroxy-4-methyl-2-oxoglutarate aldolase
MERSSLPLTHQAGSDVDDPIAAALRREHVAVISDTLDELGYRQQALDPSIRLIGDTAVVGRAFPIVVHATAELPDQPYQMEIQALEAVSPGEVMVYGGELTGAALFGELFAYAARARGALGAVIDGHVRDIAQLIGLGYPVFARGASVLDSKGRAGVIGFGETTLCGGVLVKRGDYIAGDVDGIVVVPAAAAAQVTELFPGKRKGESGAREELKAGTAIQDVWERWRTF